MSAACRNLNMNEHSECCQRLDAVCRSYRTHDDVGLDRTARYLPKCIGLTSFCQSPRETNQGCQASNQEHGRNAWKVARNLLAISIAVRSNRLAGPAVSR